MNDGDTPVPSKLTEYGFVPPVMVKFSAAVLAPAGAVGAKASVTVQLAPAAKVKGRAAAQLLKFGTVNWRGLVPPSPAFTLVLTFMVILLSVARPAQ